MVTQKPAKPDVKECERCFWPNHSGPLGTGKSGEGGLPQVPDWLGLLLGSGASPSGGGEGETGGGRAEPQMSES